MRGDVIIKQGDPGDFFYVVSSGKADIFVNGTKVYETGAGKSFGELALLYDAPRAATIVASTDEVRTWAVDRITFKQVRGREGALFIAEGCAAQHRTPLSTGRRRAVAFHVCPPPAPSFQVMMGTTEKKREKYESFLRGVPIFASLDHNDILTIADSLFSVAFADGERAIVQGDADCDRFFIVEEGEFKVEKEGAAEELCERLRPGAFFGERALIMETSRAATVTAVGASKCLALERTSFRRLMGPIYAEFARHMETYESPRSAPT